MTSTRSLTVTFVAVATATLGVAVLSPSTAGATPPTINCPASGSTSGLVDFDGDGIADAVVAAPGADQGKGAIEVRYSRGSKTTTFTPGDGVIPAVTGSGPALTFATFDANSDGCTDLAIGIPSYTVNTVAHAGAVQVLYGSKDGFVTGPLINPNNASLPGTAQAGEHFGAAIAGSGSQLTVGAPGWSPTISGAHATPHAGEAIVMYLNYYATSGFGQVFAIRKSYPHKNDRLGTSVAPGVAAAPTANGNGKTDAGCFAWATSTEDVVTYCGHHTADRLGASLSIGEVTSAGQQLYVGSPGHEVMITTTVKHGTHKGATHTRTVTDAGAVEQFALTYSKGARVVKLEKIVNQGTTGVPGDPTHGNEFGYSVTTFAGTVPLLAVGVPGEAVKGHPHAGVVLLQRGDKASSPWEQIDRDVKGVAGAATTNDRLGSALKLVARGYPGAARDFILYVGVPNDDVSGHTDAGRAQLFYGRGTKPELTTSRFLRDKGGAVAHGQYGFAVD
jgi:FG-GAP-like repeat